MRIVIFLGLGLALMVHATPVQFQSSERQTTLIELYTSEGCSNCPRAEKWLSKLKNDSRLWNDLVPVAFHIDYWNNRRRDELSDPQFSARQESYARLWKSALIYTPEYVLNGKEWYNLFALRGLPAVPSSKPGILRVFSDDNTHWLASFVPSGAPVEKYELTVAVLASGVGSDARVGANSGRNLQHDFAALSLTTHPLVSGTNGFRGTFVIDSNPKGISGHLALAAWVTHSGRLEPLQATGGWLSVPEKQ